MVKGRLRRSQNPPGFKLMGVRSSPPAPYLLRVCGECSRRLFFIAQVFLLFYPTPVPHSYFMANKKAEIRKYSETLIIESNRYREKTWEEKLREAEALEKILKPKAKEKQIEGGREKVVQNSSQPKTREQIAQNLGTSHDTLSKVKFIAKEKPELIKSIDSGIRPKAPLFFIMDCFKKVNSKEWGSEMILKNSQERKSGLPLHPILLKHQEQGDDS